MMYSDKSEFLQTPRGQYGRYMARRLTGRSRYTFDVEPKSKKSMKAAQKIAFQQDLLEILKKSKRRAYRAPIVAELSFDVIGNTPPFIHTVVKNFQDLFEQPHPESPIRRKGLVYQNDKNIYGLSVRYHIGDEQQVRANFAPFRDFIADLELADKIISGDYSDHIGSYEFEKLSDEFQLGYNDYGHDAAGSPGEFVKEKDEYVQVVGEEAYQAMLLFHRRVAQEELLSRFNIDLRELCSFYSPLIMIQRFGRQNPFSDGVFGSMHNSISESIAKSPIRIQFPNVPIQSKNSGKTLFKKQIESCLKQFKNKYPIFTPLHIPVHLNILYKSPKTAGDFSKDMDNIMRIIVPIFNEIFEPPSTHVSHVKLDNIKDPKLYASLKEMQERIPKTIRTSVSGYDIFQMPRLPEDDRDGFLTASFSCGTSNLMSPMRKIDDLIDKWYDCCRE